MTRCRPAWMLATPLLLTAAARPAQDTDLQWEPYSARTSQGGAIEGRLGRLEVPENRSSGERTIEIAFVVYETADPEPGAPIFFLAGGPGAPGIDLAAEAATDPRLGLLEHHDVVGIDQRGTGLSLPNLSEGPDFDYELPLDQVVTREALAAAYSEAVERCVAHWTAEGVDLAAYNTVESADDVEAVRAALGYDRIVPWGTSYGSHLGLAYLRRHADHAARAVLMKVEGPDDTHKLPSVLQRRLDHLAALVAADPSLGEQLPDLTGTVRGLVEQLECEPVTLEMSIEGESATLAIGPLDLQVLVSSALGFGPNLGDLPMAIHMMSQGEWRHVRGIALRNRRGSVGSAMPLMMDCSSGASAARLERIDKERVDEANVLADAVNAPFYPATCAPCGDLDLGEEFRAPFACDVPVLFVSGELDGRTPPDNVEAIRAGFSNHAHVIATNTGHEDGELESEEYCDLVRAFLYGEEVEDTTIDLPPIEFRALRTR